MGSEAGRKNGAMGDQYSPDSFARTYALVNFNRESEARMKKTNTPVDRTRLGLVIALAGSCALLAGLTGCVGYADPGYGGGAVVVGGPGYIYGGYDEGFGGYYGRGHDVRGFSGRGAASRAVAHGGGGHGGGGGRR